MYHANLLLYNIPSQYMFGGSITDIHQH